ncbi:hypothetical protein A7985_07370 [Pseudoalteromonas luteoviolacea]|uniref:Uncharacterized protein n=1 Tax=Pseudoalteromonas luteoviolacea TaxID=43657 RepID=A0A1C0TWR0_9GAMM|nr:hypothetical protein [Pseudoalteromonas luteoviolacea]OCQ23751.1 hypothetical protein A7985_07370 [Pseudoalteromonas luteoviolacea]
MEVGICLEALAVSEIIAALITNDQTLLPAEARKWLNRIQGMLIVSEIMKENKVMAQTVENGYFTLLCASIK